MYIDFGYLKIIFALLIFALIMLGGWYPFKKRRKTKGHIDFPIGETLATGVFLGAALLHMLPEANTLFNEHGYKYPFAAIILGTVFLFFLWFEHLGKELYAHHEPSHPSFALLAWAMLSLHSIMLGTALGFTPNNSMAIMLFFAIIIHKWAESFAIAVQLIKSSLTIYQNMLLFVIFGLMTPVGVFLGWYFGYEIKTNSILEPILIASSAGTFLYLGTLHGLERCVMVKQCCDLRNFSFVIVGFLLMAIAAIYI